MNETKTTLSRRDFLQRAAVLGAACVGAGSLLAACQSDKERPARPAGAAATGAAALNCTDVSALNDQQKAGRTTNGYVEKSTKAGQDCTNCVLYTMPAAAGQCGGCSVVAGPINPAGWCNIWVVKA
ncbi:MAG: high-potential iron-sulfur protein [Bradymonadaceae bacterium]|nr:high-potential iron-sulfur protein [Lujinxingiaceae bacterium]